MTSQEILDNLKVLEEMGVIAYVLPTDPLGLSWTIGIRTIGQGRPWMITLPGDETAVAFLVGVNTMSHMLRRLRGE
jgi:hypothetical protein